MDNKEVLEMEDLKQADELIKEELKEAKEVLENAHVFEKEDKSTEDLEDWIEEQGIQLRY